MELNKAVELGLLLDTYGELLTPKKREMLSMYVNENMSYQEIATFLNISKPAVLDAIKIAENKLIKLEKTLKMLSFKQKLSHLVETSTNLRKDVISLLKEV